MIGDLLPKYVRKWLWKHAWKFPNIIGFSESWMPRERHGVFIQKPVIRFYVTKKQYAPELKYEDYIPAWITIRHWLRKHSFDTDVVELKEVKALAVDKTKNWRPVELGVSVGNECLPFTAKITTKDGLKMIGKIKIGDYVLTHRNRFKKVIKTFKRRYVGKLVQLSFFDPQYGTIESRKFSATVGHPILTIEDNKPVWKEIKDIKVGDYILVEANQCKICGCDIPYFWQYCPIHHSTEENVGPKRIPNQHHLLEHGGEHLHYTEDILPAAKDLEKQGFRVVPIGKIIPDIIAIKDDKIYAVEVEDLTQSYNLKPNYAKYPNEISQYIDDVIWIVKEKQRKTDKRKANVNFINGLIDGFVAVKVTSKRMWKIPETRTRNRKSQFHVYNLEVEHDNSFVAGRVVMHNCITAGSLGMLYERTKTETISLPLSTKVYNPYYFNHYAEKKTTTDIVAGSNAHVLTDGDPSKTPEQIVAKNILQRGYHHGGRVPDDVVGQYVWHQKIYPIEIPSECPVSRLAAWLLNGMASLLGRKSRFRAYQNLTNTIDFAIYKPSVKHALKIADSSIDVKLPFVGHLYAGSDVAGVLCGIAEIMKARPDLKPANNNWCDVKVGDRVKMCSFWCNTEREVIDTNATLQVNYGNFIALFSKAILVENDGTIKGGYSGSGVWLV